MKIIKYIIITRIRNKCEEVGAKDFIKTKRGQGYIV